MDIMWLKSNIKTSLDQMQKEAELKAQEEDTKAEQFIVLLLNEERME